MARINFDGGRVVASDTALSQGNVIVAVEIKRGTSPIGEDRETWVVQCRIDRCNANATTTRLSSNGVNAIILMSGDLGPLIAMQTLVVPQLPEHLEPEELGQYTRAHGDQRLLLSVCESQNCAEHTIYEITGLDRHIHLHDAWIAHGTPAFLLVEDAALHHVQCAVALCVGSELIDTVVETDPLLVVEPLVGGVYEDRILIVAMNDVISGSVVAIRGEFEE